MSMLAPIQNSRGELCFPVLLELCVHVYAAILRDRDACTRPYSCTN